MVQRSTIQRCQIYFNSFKNCPNNCFEKWENRAALPNFMKYFFIHFLILWMSSSGKQRCQIYLNCFRNCPKNCFINGEIVQRCQISQNISLFTSWDVRHPSRTTLPNLFELFQNLPEKLYSVAKFHKIFLNSFFNSLDVL